MSSIFKSLTKYIPELENARYGEWTIDKINEGTSEHPIQMPFVNYFDVVTAFEKDVYKFMDDNKDMHLNQYAEILRNNGIDWDARSMQVAKVPSLDAQCVMALIMGAVRAEHFCNGALLDFFNNGCIVKWLKRLDEFN